MFKTTVEAGPVALLLAALVFLIMAISGALPRSLEWGDKKMQFGEADGDALDEGLEQRGLSPSQRVAVADSLDRAGVPTELTAPITSAVAFEESTARLILQLVERGAGSFKVHPNSGDGTNASPNLTLVRKDGGIVFVDIEARWPTWNLLRQADWFSNRIELLGQVNERLSGLLYVTRNVEQEAYDFISGKSVRSSVGIPHPIVIVDMAHSRAGVRLEKALQDLGLRHTSFENGS